jgi:SAM-dependent methyltransferase
MPAAILRQLSRLAPPEVRRVAVGLLTDVRSLPARVVDRGRRGEPWSVVHDVGDGDYRMLGRQIARWLVRFGGLRADSSVLDIGCGTGRVAEPLGRILGPQGRYRGFDVSDRAIRFCQARFADDPRLRFHRLDVQNGFYNRTGEIPESQVRFPAEDASVDIAFATSVFTHMRLGSVETYVAEAARTLRPHGVLLFSAFTLEPGRERSPALPFQPFEPGSAVVNPRSPEQAIAHRREVLDALVRRAGLRPDVLLRGEWHPPAAYDGGQDLWIAVK